MVTRYIPTALPAKLDMSRGDSYGQLRSREASRCYSTRDGVEPEQRKEEKMNATFHDLVQSHMKAFIVEHSSQCHDSTTLFSSWLRLFHSEYGDKWFSKNQDRLTASFRPIWVKLHSRGSEVSTPETFHAPLDFISILGAGTGEVKSDVLPDLLG